MAKTKRRSWIDAEMKKERESACRVCASHDIVTEGPLESAHTIGRSQDRWRDDLKAYWVDPDSVVPLCRRHHAMFDQYELDLGLYLNHDELHVALDQCRNVPHLYRELYPASFAAERV